MSEPDPRWSLANERTALAWVRTSLALVAGGVGLTSLVRSAHLARAIDLLAAAITLLGAFLGGSALRTFRRRDSAMRAGQPLPPTNSLALLVGSLVVVAVAVALYVVVSAF